jgi:hypothetical protein
MEIGMAWSSSVADVDAAQILTGREKYVKTP